MKNIKLFAPIVLTLTSLTGLARAVLAQNAIRTSERLGYSSVCGDSQDMGVLKDTAAIVFFPMFLEWVPVREASLPRMEQLVTALTQGPEAQRFDAAQYDAFVTAMREAVTLEHTVGDVKLTITPTHATIERVKPLDPKRN